MKKIIIFIFLFMVSFSTSEAEEYIEKDRYSEVLKIDIQTLQYEQRQLVYAVITGNEEDVKTILNSESNPQTTYAKIPLNMFAIYSNHVNILKILTEKGFNPNESVMDVTPIELAISMKRYDCIKYLLSVGAELKNEDIELIKKSKNKKLKALFK